MVSINNYLFNPILSPDVKHSWEKTAVFNGSVVQDNNKFLMVYRCVGDNLSTIGLATSHDGYNFSHRKQILKPEYPWEQYGLEDPRITQIDGKFYIFYTAISEASPGPNSIKIAVAITTDFITFEKHLVTPFNAKAMALFPKKINGQFVAILSANTDLPPSKTALAFFDKESDIWSSEFWEKWYKNLNKNELIFRRITSDHTEIGAVPIYTEFGWVLIYSYNQNYFNGSFGTFGIEAVLLDRDDPRTILGRTSRPLMVPQETYELEGMVSHIVFPSGAIIKDDEIFIYYGAADNYVALATVKTKELLIEMLRQVNVAPKLKRNSGNPIIIPEPLHDWESRATFNPAAVLIDDTVHIVYRAMSMNNTSVFGYAKSLDGLTIFSKSSQPIYVPRSDFETNPDPNGFGGCEDPRITRIGDDLYICYTAYDGHNPPKIALTSISVTNFVLNKWDFKKPIVISDPSFDNKDGCLFPDTFDGKFAFLHREGGRGIMIDYVDNLEFNEKHLEGEICFVIGSSSWENSKMGIAAPPLKTDKGWLLLYHGVSKTDQNYRVGAMLLKLNDPRIVLGRTHFPILEPETDYEKYGEVSNVVFPCGAVIKNNELLVYYGGADKVIGVASGNINQILDALTL